MSRPCRDGNIRLVFVLCLALETGTVADPIAAQVYIAEAQH
ncbi:hypothetical protein [Cognatiyoonia koreensis]|nr:hypothetical protein [Cognatiyoonia koreensis]